MMRWQMRRRRVGDDGTVLILALIVVTVVAVVTGMVLTRGDGSLRATVALRNVAGSGYAADGAAQVAINALRTGFWDGSGTAPPNWAYNNEVGDGCFGRNDNASILTPDVDLVLSEFYPAVRTGGEGPTSAYVRCNPEDATGAQGTARHVTSANSPGDAIITLGNSAVENGIYARTNNNSLTVRGGIKSNSNIVADRPIEVQDANVRARSGCTGTIDVSLGYNKLCNLGTGPTDPDYAMDISAIPQLQQVPTACGGSHYIAFEPGYYDDVTALEYLTTNCNKIFWFKPGTYYFDFHRNTNDPLFHAGLATAGDDEWLISKGRLIAGNPIDPVTKAVLTAPPTNPTIPGSCQNPIDDAGAQGVQFIFGGDSRMHVAGNPADPEVELCATYRSTVPPIVIYGAKTGSAPVRTDLTFANGNDLVGLDVPVQSASSGSDGAFTGLTPGAPPSTGPMTAAAIATDGGDRLVWQRSAAGSAVETRTLRLGGFQPANQLPKGSILKTARVTVRTKAASTAANVEAPTLTLRPRAPGATPLASYALPKNSALTTDTITLNATTNATLFNALSQSIHRNGYTGMDVDLLATARATQSVELDKLRIELEYYVPQLRGQTSANLPGNCIATLGGGCAVLQSDHNFKGKLYLQGTTYTPIARLDIGLGNLTAQVFRWGLIARSLAVESTGAFGYSGAVIELPDNSPGLGLDGTLVQLKVYVCRGASTCDDTGTLALKVRLQLWDESGSTIPGEREVTVLSWSHTR